MKKVIIVASVVALSLASASTCYAATATKTQTKATSSESKMAKAGKSIKEGVLWAPRKIGEGMKAMGEKTKKAFHKGK